MSDHEYDIDWDEHVDALAQPMELSVNGFESTVECSQEILQTTILPLLSVIRASQRQMGKRCIVGLAGVPGSGKSTFALTLQEIAHCLPDMPRLQVVGVDGWHWPNRVLAERTFVDEQCQTVALDQRKGSVASFDVKSLAGMLAKLRSTRDVMTLPVYDRNVHEPILNGMTVEPDIDVILLEGNYLLCDDYGWSAVHAQLDLALYLECDSALAMQRVIDRHVRGGMSLEQAIEKCEVNDQPNSDKVFASQSSAAYLIQLQPDSESRR